MSGYTFIDLFAGGGGLSEGFTNENFVPIAHVEKNTDACETLKTRAIYHFLNQENDLQVYRSYLKGTISKEELYNMVPPEILNLVLKEEISEQSFEKIVEAIPVQNVDLIVGGPPCQAYSIVGRARVREEDRKKNDPRRFLYKQYIKFLQHYRPKVFVFENVPGILNLKDIDNQRFIEKIESEFKQVGYKMKHKLLDASNFGVLQRRLRVIIIGWQEELDLDYPDFESEVLDNNSWNVQRDILDDLPKLQAGEFHLGFDYASSPSNYLNKFGIRISEDILIQHYARFTNENDKEIYRLTIEKWYNEGKRLHYNEIPERLKRQKNQQSFLNRFSVVEGNMPFSHTMVAHIAIDGHYYIHPDTSQSRSLTIREAARIQSFPDNYFFEGSRKAAFQQIGNAVPPIFARAIARKIKEMLWKLSTQINTSSGQQQSISLQLEKVL